MMSAASIPRPFASYELLDTVGRGGMAELYLARAPSSLGTGRRVVLKLVPPEGPDSVAHQRLLAREACLGARLSHRNIVRVEHLGRCADALFLVMEYVEGLDLRELLRSGARRGLWPSPALSLFVVRELLAALDHAHRLRGADGEPAGIVHRDVSPANVLLSFDGEVKLCDFGIACEAHDEADAASVIEGKAGYMSPEQARGQRVAPSADLFAAGIILWELLSKRRMYKAAAGESPIRVAQAAIIPPLAARGLPRQHEIEAIVHLALAVDPADRFGSARAFRQALDDYVAAAGLEMSSLRVGRWLRQHFVTEPVRRRHAREKALPLQQPRASLPIDVVSPPRLGSPVATLLLHALISATVTFGLLWALVGVVS